MKQALIDTDILSLFLRGDVNVVAHAKAYTATYPQFDFTIITYYEILSGLYFRDARKQVMTFLELASQSHIVPITTASVEKSAELYAELRKSGQPLDDIDLLIAGVALLNDWTLVTRNGKHFDRIATLDVEDWTQP